MKKDGVPGYILPTGLFFRVSFSSKLLFFQKMKQELENPVRFILIHTQVIHGYYWYPLEVDRHP